MTKKEREELAALIAKNKEETKQAIKELIITYAAERKSQIVEVFSTLGKRYFDAPASGKFHESFEGGLAAHCLDVTNLMYRLKPAFDTKVSNEGILIVGLFHDLGKIGTSEEPYYIPQLNEWRRDKLGERYERGAGAILPHAMLSLMLLAHVKFPLTQEEYLAVLCHDLLFVDENTHLKRRRESMNDLMLLTHFADLWVTTDRN